MSTSSIVSKIIARGVAMWIIWLHLILGRRSDPPVHAVDVANQPRPCWVAYAAGERVTPLPDRTPWAPRYKAETDGTEKFDYPQSA
jgi:hypothetical protein